MGMLLIKNLFGRPWFDTFFAGAKNTHHERRAEVYLVGIQSNEQCG
jgi:hypothetical protein